MEQERFVTKQVMQWKEAALNGDSDAMNKLGEAYSRGKGVPKNHKEAIRWWRKAAKAGNGEAMLNLGEASQEQGNCKTAVR